MTKVGRGSLAGDGVRVTAGGRDPPTPGDGVRVTTGGRDPPAPGDGVRVTAGGRGLLASGVPVTTGGMVSAAGGRGSPGTGGSPATGGQGRAGGNCGGSFIWGSDEPQPAQNPAAGGISRPHSAHELMPIAPLCPR